MSTENKPEPLVSDVWIDTRHQTYDHRECIVANRAAMAVRDIYEADRAANLKTIDDLRAQVERMRWIPVEERLPEDGHDVLVCTKYNYRGCAVYADGYWYLNIAPESDQPEGVVTHWMPLPTTPTPTTDGK